MRLRQSANRPHCAGEWRTIIDFYGLLRQLTDPSLETLFTQTQIIYETMEVIR